MLRSYLDESKANGLVVLMTSYINTIINVDLMKIIDFVGIKTKQW